MVGQDIMGRKPMQLFGFAGELIIFSVMAAFLEKVRTTRDEEAGRGRPLMHPPRAGRPVVCVCTRPVLCCPS